MPNHSQLKRAMRCVDKLKGVIEECEVERLIYKPLREIVYMAQNPLPDGEGDGSIGYDDWSDLSDLVRVLGKTFNAVDKIVRKG